MFCFTNNLAQAYFKTKSNKKHTQRLIIKVDRYKFVKLRLVGIYFILDQRQKVQPWHDFKCISNPPKKKLNKNKEEPKSMLLKLYRKIS